MAEIIVPGGGGGGSKFDKYWEEITEDGEIKLRYKVNVKTPENLNPEEEALFKQLKDIHDEKAKKYAKA